MNDCFEDTQEYLMYVLGKESLSSAALSLTCMAFRTVKSLVAHAYAWQRSVTGRDMRIATSALIWIASRLAALCTVGGAPICGSKRVDGDILPSTNNALAHLSWSHNIQRLSTRHNP